MGFKSINQSGINDPGSYKIFSKTKSIFSGGNISYSSIYDVAKDMSTVSTDIAPQNGGSLSIDSSSLGMYEYTVKNSSQTISSFISSDWFTTNKDTYSSWITVKGNLTINSGQTLIPPSRKLFVVIYVTGNLTLNGSISMTARGANHSGTGDSGGYTAPANIRIINGTYSSVLNPSVPAIGGAAISFIGTKATGANGNSGSNGGSGGGGCGGRGDGATYSTGGAAGTSFSSGSGGGGAYGGGSPSDTSFGYAGRPNGGAGGEGGDSNNTVSSGGGAGNPGGAAWYTGAAGTSGTAGTIIVIVEGTLTGSGSIVSNGSSGGNAGSTNNWSNGGGGSGGGSVNLLVRSDSSSVTLQAVGGSGGTQGSSINAYAGGAGGAGTARKLILV